MIRARTISALQTAELASALCGVSQPRDLILLTGDLGAGKTAFSKGFGAALGVAEPITSPTFTLVREYRGRTKLYHLDVYRINDISEVAGLGLGELLDEEAITIIEWGRDILSALPGNYLEICIELGGNPNDDDDVRTFQLSTTGAGWSARMHALRSALEPWILHELPAELTGEPAGEPTSDETEC